MQTLQPIILQRTTVTASVVSHLREEIIAGRLPTGDPLPESRVGEILSVSRAPVREALTLLEREGLVAFDRRGTARVCAFGRDDIRELGLMRLALEPVAARQVGERRSKETLAAIEDNLQGLKQAASLEEVTRLDLEFHRLIMKGTGNRRLLTSWEGLASQFRLVMTRFHRFQQSRTRNVRESTYQGHAELFAGLQKRSAGDAEAIAREHAAQWLDQLEDFADQQDVK